MFWNNRKLMPFLSFSIFVSLFHCCFGNIYPVCWLNITPKTNICGNIVDIKVFVYDIWVTLVPNHNICVTIDQTRNKLSWPDHSESHKIGVNCHNIKNYFWLHCFPPHQSGCRNQHPFPCPLRAGQTVARSNHNPAQPQVEDKPSWLQDTVGCQADQLISAGETRLGQPQGKVRCTNTRNMVTGFHHYILGLWVGQL